MKMMWRRLSSANVAASIARFHLLLLSGTIFTLLFSPIDGLRMIG